MVAIKALCMENAATSREKTYWNTGVENAVRLIEVAPTVELAREVPQKIVKRYGKWPDGQKRTFITCPACKYDVDEEDNYCSECGQRLEGKKCR